MDASNILACIVMSTLVPLTTKMVGETTGVLRDILTAIWKWLYRKFGPKINTVLIEFDKTTTKSKFITTSENSQNNLLIDAVLYVISKQKTPIPEFKCRIDPMLTSRPIHKIPTSTFKYLDYEISYDREENASKDAAIVKSKTVLKITSRKSSDDIYAFVKDCYKQYISSQTEDKDLRYEYMQVPCKTGVSFLRYRLNSLTTFDSLFFPTKKRVLGLVKKLESGGIDKLAFCLHGEAGCGKTSFVKALANLTGKHIVTVKMSYMKNDLDVKNIFNNPNLLQEGFGGAQHIREVPIGQRIYLLEDLDAETDVCHKRKTEVESEPTPKVKDKYEMAMKMLNKKKVTLSGILNALDGVVEVKGAIIVITTNHREKLDPALLRYGRITMDIEMQRMLASDAHQVIKKYYGKYSATFPIRDYTITPATLDAFCKQSDSLSELSELLRGCQ